MYRKYLIYLSSNEIMKYLVCFINLKHNTYIFLDIHTENNNATLLR